MISHQIHFVFIELLAQIIDQRDPICDVSFRCQCGAIYGVKGFAGSWLFPVDDHEVILQSAKSAAFSDQLAAAGSACQEEQDRLACVPAADRNPLFTSIQIHFLQCSDAARDGFPLRIVNRWSFCEKLRSDDRNPAYDDDPSRLKAMPRPAGLRWN